MTRETTSAVAVGGGRFRVQTYPIPDVQRDDGVLRVEACGVCGSDLKKCRPEGMAATVLGHETVGTIDELGDLAAARWGVEQGSRVLIEEYLPCGHCRFCRTGEYRSCTTTDNTRAGALRYGSTPADVPPAIWGGYSRHQYLHPSTVVHAVPPGVSPEHATFGIPLGNGVQWAQLDGGVRAGDTVLIMGPGQQGASCLVTCREAGAANVVVAGLQRDAGRLDIAIKLGATTVVDSESEDPVAAVQAATSGELADLVIDTSGGGAATLMTALRAVRVGGTVVVASGKGHDEDGLRALDLGLVRKKRVTIKGVRGHSYAAVERALQMIAAGTAGLDLMSGAPFGLDAMEPAMAAAAGATDRASLHVVVDPWR